MKIWKEETFTQLIGSLIWDTSETLKIPLGKFAPRVFNWMMGSKGKRM